MTILALILVFLTLALIVSGALMLLGPPGRGSSAAPDAIDGEIESELLRRPLRSRHPV